MPCASNQRTSARRNPTITVRGIQKQLGFVSLNPTYLAGDALPVLETAVMEKVKERAAFLWEGWIDWDNCWEIQPLSAYAWQAIEDESADSAFLANIAAFFLEMLADYAGAEPLYIRSLVIREKVLVPNHPDVARSLNSLAALYDNRGIYQDAELLYKRALDISEKVFGHNHSDVAQSLNNLASLYYHQGRYQDAELLCTQALVISEKVFGANHPDVAVTLFHLANIYVKQCRYQDAEPLYKRALAIFVVSLGVSHPRTQTARGSYVGLLQTMGRSRDEIAATLRAIAPQFFPEQP